MNQNFDDELLEDHKRLRSMLVSEHPDLVALFDEMQTAVLSHMDEIRRRVRKEKAGQGEPTAASKDLEAFAKAVIAAARSSPTGWFGRNKVFIHHVFTVFDRSFPQFHLWSIEPFKRRLLEARNAGLLELSRADLVQVMDQDDVEKSRTGGSTARSLDHVNFVTLPEETPRVQERPVERRAPRRTAQEEREEKRREQRVPITNAALESIHVLYYQHDTGSTWGIPYDMRSGQQPADLLNNEKAIASWIWLGTPGYFGSMSREEMGRVKAYLKAQKESDKLPRRPGEWSQIKADSTSVPSSRSPRIAQITVSKETYPKIQGINIQSSTGVVFLPKEGTVSLPVGTPLLFQWPVKGGKGPQGEPATYVIGRVRGDQDIELMASGVEPQDTNEVRNQLVADYEATLSIPDEAKLLWTATAGSPFTVTPEGIDTGTWVFRYGADRRRASGAGLVSRGLQKLIGPNQYAWTLDDTM